ncbi:MAG: LPS biosynthesis protein WbpP [Planctomycetaceae bacterium]|nr:LPS biosynthesis protein WbpP [Planctomycetaceae bacterium]
MDWRELHGDAFVGRRVMVTGGAGFIGSHLVEALVGLDAEVVAYDDLSGGDWGNLDGFGDSVEKIGASILDADALTEATAGCEVVFHEAAKGSVPGSVDDPELYHHVNVMGTLNVLQASQRAQVRRVLFAASSSAYGNPADDGAAKVETMAPLPLSPYAATKLACEHDMRAWSASYDLDTVSLRYFNVFGPRQNANSAYAAVIAAFAKALIHDRPPLIYGDGEQTRDFTFVHNVVHINLLAALCDQPLGGEVINAACGQRVSINELADRVIEIFDRPDMKAEHKPSRAGEVMHSLADISRARQLLGYAPLVSFEQGLAPTVDWYRENPVATA